ncbi:transmembrane protein, putative (macronuclear) [Tetrahymena thermophila SB210]|uniref:Transmembrane protein, putative n=1 Tax=Tetrahymena thermophila (strain SB210) TaxID=312017 RepID=W7X4C3_TETTS|nr:transmembrane protein, putative [Tetrahymena thermophila SB210]EWS72277.1 transmembrane protein, putative [Tetrahymena thermophila SB210]|eukprot:XP_012655217.1 transmembrane protein, putative [Tetrahymena thermophila SB210]
MVFKKFNSSSSLFYLNEIKLLLIVLTQLSSILISLKLQIILHKIKQNSFFKLSILVQNEKKNFIQQKQFQNCFLKYCFYIQCLAALFLVMLKTNKLAIFQLSFLRNINFLQIMADQQLFLSFKLRLKQFFSCIKWKSPQKTMDRLQLHHKDKINIYSIIQQKSFIFQVCKVIKSILRQKQNVCLKINLFFQITQNYLFEIQQKHFIFSV